MMYNHHNVANEQERHPMQQADNLMLSPSSAALLRTALRQERLNQLGGEALDGSGFERETPEPDFEQSE
jgi:hypothetical protein